MKMNLILFVFLVVMAITNAQMLNQFGMDFANFPTMKKSSDSFGFSANNNMIMGIPNEFPQINNKANMPFSQNSQQTQQSQTFQSFQNSLTNQQPLQASQSFQTFQTSQPITTQTITVNQPLEKLASIR
jgi:hypothetical protein